METVVSYIEANVVCCIILLMILFNEQRVSDRADYRVLFSQFLLFTVLYTLADTAWALTEQNVIPRNTVSLGIVNLIYMATVEIASYHWLLYCFSFSKSPHLRSRESRRKIAVPIVCAIVLVVIELSMGNNIYMDVERGMQLSAAYILSTLPYLCYLLLASVHCFKAVGENRYGAQRLQFLSMALYPLFMLLAHFLQFLSLNLPTITYAATIACLFIYMVSLQNMISQDALTQMNNRNQLNQFMAGLDNSENQKLCMLMVDANSFKSINDTYGHASGDDALKAIGSGLKEACGMMGSLRPFAARYGGDEFFVALHTDDDAAVIAFARHVKEEIENAREKMELPFELSVTIGWAFLRSGEAAVDCMARADAALYQKKRRLKAER